VLLLLFGVSAETSAQPHNYIYIGFGGDSCGKWIEARARGQSVGMQYWVLGYISGVNTFRAEGNDFLKEVDAAATFGWLDNYCRSQPLDPFAVAVNKLTAELKIRAH